MIEFSCPQCGRSFKVSDDHAGKRATCKDCNTLMVIPSGTNPYVPKAMPSQTMPQIPPPQMMVPPPTYRSANPKGNHMSKSFIAGFGGCLGAGAALLVVLVGCPMMFSVGLQTARTNARISAEKQNQEAHWSDAKYNLTRGDVKIKVMKAVVDHVPLKFMGDSKSEDKLLAIQVRITNLHSEKILKYDSWGSEPLDLDPENRAVLKDNYGNTYNRCHFGIGTRVVGQVRNESIYPHRFIDDILVFEPPTYNCEYLLLKLPCETYGGEGEFRIKIPRSMIEFN